MISQHGVCDWATKHPLEREYHDREWGKPIYDDKQLFEFITLEGAQAGLSWLVILKKRAAYFDAFEGYDLETLAHHNAARVETIIEHFDVVKHRGKIQSVFNNAQAALKLQREYGSLSHALWQFVDHTPKVNHWVSMSEVPTVTPISREMSQFLKQKGFKFVGETICYSFMQAVGMINDHLIDCPSRQCR
jgi:DNA-3-methyladenine glycosylase I